MPNTTVYTNNQYYQDIADAIRNKNGSNTLYKPSEMAPAINSLIVSGGSILLQTKTVNPTTSQQVVTYDSGYNGLGSVTISAIQTESKTVTSNGTVTPSSGKFLSSVIVNVPIGATINNQSKTITPSETEQVITADDGYTGLNDITIEAIDSGYIGSSVPRKTSANLTTSGATVTAPAGYYASAASASVATATQATPSLSVNSSGLVTATAAQTAGYVTAGSKSSTLQLTTQAATTVAPNTTEQTIVTAGKYTTGAIKVSAIPTQTKTAVSNGTILPDTGYYLTEVEVDVPSDINNQSKTVTPTESEQQITADSGYSGLSDVTVEAISSNYVGSGITRRSNSDLSASGATVSVPSGYYASNASKSVATTTVATPSISIDNSGKISSSVTQTAGYVAADTKTNNLQMTTIAATTITPSSSSQTAVAKNVYTLGAITVAAVPTETKTVTSNGTVTPSAGKFLSSVVVNVPAGATINNQNKTITPTESEQTIEADSGYTGLGTVTVGAISSTYVGSGITRRDDTDLSASGATITVPAGYYEDSETKSVNTVQHATPTISVDTSTGTITATHAQAGGYINEDTTTATKSLSTQAAKTITPNSNTQTAVAAGKYTLGAVTVEPVPTETKIITENGTFTPNTGRYFSSITVNVPTIEINQDANGYLVIDDDGNYNITDRNSNLDFLASNTSGPSVRKFFYALQTGAFEHGEFTLTSTPTNAFVDLFTMTNFSADNPPQGIIIIDKGFYEGATLPHNSSEAIAFLWFDKAFVSPGKDDAMTTTYPYYGAVREQINKTTTSGVVSGDSATIFNGTDDKFRGYYLFNDNKLTWKSRFGGQQYTTFIANRPYIWMVY